MFIRERLLLMVEAIDPEPSYEKRKLDATCSLGKSIKEGY